MRNKMVAMIMTAALAALSLAGCTPEAAEAEVTYKVVGGISEPVRVWNEVADDAVVSDDAEVAPEGETLEEEAETEYIPDVLPMEPTAFVTNKAADTLTSDKDGEVVDTLEEGAELVLVGTTGKGYYQTEDGSFISASDVEKVVIEGQVAETKPQTTTTTQSTALATTTTESAAPAQESQPEQEQPTQEQQTTYEEPAQQETQTAEAPAEESQPAVVTEEVEDTSRSTVDEAWEQLNAELDAREEAARNCSHSSSHWEVYDNQLAGGYTHDLICDNCGAVLDGYTESY